MKVLLISANKLIEPYPVYPIGLDYVAGAIADDHAVSILDLNHLPGRMDLDTAIRQNAPDLIGLSMRNIDNTDISHPVGFMAPYRDLVQTVRRICPAPIVLGGSGFTLFPRQAMDLVQADYGIVGEGERLRLLLTALARGLEPAGIDGVMTRTTGGSRPGPWPHGFQRRIDPDQAHLTFYLNNGGMLNLQTKRGCPFRCVYCTYPHIEGRTLRLIDPDEVARTATQLQAAGARFLFITDSAFNADIVHSLAVAQAFKKAGLTIPWGAFFAPLPFPRDYYQILADCGLSHAEFGTESICDPVLAAYGKPFRCRDILPAHQAARAAGLNVAHYFLFGGPGETAATLSETLAGMEKLEKAVLFLFCGMRIYPHTALHALALKQGRISASRNLTEPTYYRSPEIGPDEVWHQVTTRAQDRLNWVLGAGGEKTARIVSRMHQRGYSGPLWEYLCI